MAEQPGSLTRGRWWEQLHFLHLFRSFKMAIQPGKLALALAGVILMGLWGGLLDGIWIKSYQVVNNEIWVYWQHSDIDLWREAAVDTRDTRINLLWNELAALGIEQPGGLDKMIKSSPDDAVELAREKLRGFYPGAIAELQGDDNAIAAQTRLYRELYERAGDLKRRGVFRSLLAYEQEVIGRMLAASRDLLLVEGSSLTDGFEFVLAERQSEEVALPAGRLQDMGVMASMVLALRGFQWLVVEHIWFALLFLLGSLAIWALLGGAICRMAAFNFARDEQIAPKHALRFSQEKFLGLFTAPLLPLLLVLVVGVALAVGGLFFAIPVLGSIVGSLLMILALLGGFVIALVIAGAIGGGSMFWPTIAVEGSDGFDAMSRSYSYFFSRPWRTAFYALVALVYGAITYGFLRLLVLLMFKATRWFVQLGHWFTDYPTSGRVHATKLEAMWPEPSLENLAPAVVPLGLGWAETFGAWLIYIWVMLVVLTLCGYLLSFFFSSATIIYFLLRQQVDATDIEDLYQDEVDEEEQLEFEFGQKPAETAGATPGPATPSSETAGGAGSSAPPPETGTSESKPAPPPETGNEPGKPENDEKA